MYYLYLKIDLDYPPKWEKNFFLNQIFNLNYSILYFYKEVHLFYIFISTEYNKNI